jgi:hypothetical protein
MWGIKNELIENEIGYKTSFLKVRGSLTMLEILVGLFCI